MESKVNKFGIIDFLKAFSSDTSIDSGKVNMRDLKAGDWKVVSETVKKELLVDSPKRIQKIYKLMQSKINETVLNVKTSISKNVKGKEIAEIKDEKNQYIEK